MTVQLVHKSLPLIERAFSAKHLNEVVNHPKVRPWVCGPLEGHLDLTPVVEDQRNYCLMGEYGGVLYHQLQPGLYEAHTQVIPEGRGEWTTKMVRATLRYIFTRTDAVEVITRVPSGNLPALALTKRMGLDLEFSRPNGWVKLGKIIPADFYSISVQKWMRIAPDLERRGQWLHKKIVQAFNEKGLKQVTYINDENQDRYAGASIEMVLYGQVAKGIALFNRWASLSGYNQVSVISIEPLVINLHGVVLLIRDGKLMVIVCP